MSILKATTRYGVAAGAPLRSCTAFLGLPYAKPPVGALRFAPPQPPEPWQGERPCLQYGNSPLSTMGDPASQGGAVPHSDDCLYLNVWTPADSPDEKLPVMFWIAPERRSPRSWSSKGTQAVSGPKGPLISCISPSTISWLSMKY